MNPLRPVKATADNDGDGHFDIGSRYARPDEYGADFYYRDDVDAVLREAESLVRQAASLFEDAIIAGVTPSWTARVNAWCKQVQDADSRTDSASGGQ